jgi:protein gp37
VNRSRGIEWAEESWNPTTGCTKLSPGCDHCWAERMARRLQGMGSPRYARGFRVTTHPELLEQPLHWRKSRDVCACFMGDLFHREVPEEFIRQVFDVMARSPQHRFHVLTKRSPRLAELSPRLLWPANVWAGVTVENTDYRFRSDHLRQTSAAVKFLVLEPLLGPIEALDLRDIDWVIVGGESGPGARPLHIDWVRSVRDQCAASGVPFSFKQWGGVRRRETGRMLDGREWTERPLREWRGVRDDIQLGFDDMEQSDDENPRTPAASSPSRPAGCFAEAEA